ncbi:NAD(P)/FAD-dependent oxidoreductase [Desulfurococcaceae archaeon MEX13E-LK6-19]|nr:NAD(P)/FAD-dependent oxidoreductase [Desulfurococcaceae archaeon MEX13E-LK6-19]
MKIIVVGGGPAGLTLASLIKNNDVIVFEEHKKVGLPLHCTSLVSRFTKDFFVELLGYKIVENYYNEVYFYTPYSVLHLRTRTPIAFRLKRPLLEEKLMDKVLKRGHVVYLGERVKKVNPKDIVSTKRSMQYDKLVIAEGASRILTRSLLGTGFNKERYIIGIQTIVKSRDIDKHTFYTFFTHHNRYFFYWLVPLGDGENALLGAGFRLGEHHIELDKIVKYISKTLKINIKKSNNIFGGLIPLLPPQKCCIGHKIYFLGDSIPAIKPFTGGGLYGIAFLAKALAEELDTEARAYKAKFNKLSFMLTIQYLVYQFAVRISGTWLVPYILSVLHNKGMEIREGYYDRHELLLIEALKTVILQPESLFDILFSLKTLLAT